MKRRDDLTPPVSAHRVSKALVRHKIDGLTYEADAAAAVEQLVRQEQRCCGFLQFDLVTGADLIQLTITAPQGAGAGARALFAHLLPS